MQHERAKAYEVAIADDIMEAEEEMAQYALDSVELGQWVAAIRQKFIVDGFFEQWYGADGRHGRVRQRKEKTNYLFRDERAAFLFWLRFDVNGHSEALWHETGKILRLFDMDFSEYLSKLVFPFYSERQPELVFELVGRSRVGFPGVFPFLAPPPWFELLNYAVFNMPLLRLPVYKVDFTKDYEVTGVSFLSPTIGEETRGWILQQVGTAYQKLATQRKEYGQPLEWYLLHRLSHEWGIRPIAREYGRPHSTVESAIYRVAARILDEDKGMDYFFAAPTIGLSELDLLEILERADFSAVCSKPSGLGHDPPSFVLDVLLCKNMLDVIQDLDNTDGFSRLGICPMPGGFLRHFVHRK
ncbi:MAG: hypothetical protein ISS52_07560 [Dehalococcoidia bacterium]|nr:hypothetical protein [Dehalococcoidia bacterium]